MPVTARLSKAFYDRLGEDIAGELVTWFNAVDATYRSDLQTLNEGNFVRFDAKLERRFAEQDARIDRIFADFEVRMERRLAELESRLVMRMFIFWAGSMVTLGGLIIALNNARR